MSIGIIRSCIDFKNNILLNTSKRKVGDMFYYYSDTVEDKDIDSIVVFKEEFKRLISTACLDSKYLRLWGEKEKMYNLNDINNIACSREYFDCKSKVTEQALRGIVFVEDSGLNVFKIRAEIVGFYKDFIETGELPITFITEYVDCLYETPYDISSLDAYISNPINFNIL